MNLSEISQKVGELNNWFLEQNFIEKVFEFSNFNTSIVFINEVAKISNELNHYPDILISYNLVRLSLTTHSEKALTIKDFEFAKMVDKININ